MTHDSIGLGEDGPTHQPVEKYLIGIAPITHYFKMINNTISWQFALLPTVDSFVLLMEMKQLEPTLLL